MRVRGWPSVLVPLLLLAGFPGCNNSRDDENPFADATRTVPPPSTAALLFVSSVRSQSAGSGREVYAVNLDGSGVTQLTFCNDDSLARQCDHAEASSSPERNRVIVRRAATDTDGNGRVDEADGMALVFLDLLRAVEAVLVPGVARVSGVDWGASGESVLYSGVPLGGVGDDIFVIRYNGQDNTNITCPEGATCDVSLGERRPRYDPSQSAALYERVDASGTRIGFLPAAQNQAPITSGPRDADPTFSPDVQRFVFRRRTNAAANGGAGSWDIVTAKLDGTDLQIVAAGPAFRGAPDWGPNGIAWAESDGVSQRLVVANPDGSGARAIVTQTASAALSSPRWLPAVP